MALYTNYYVRRSGEVATQRAGYAMPPAAMWHLAKYKNSNISGRRDPVTWVARYFPSRKAWRVYDLRKFEIVHTARGRSFTRVPKPSCETPGVEGALMFCTLMGGGDGS